MTDPITDQHLFPQGPLKSAPQQHACILSLNGGGYRGLFTARLLARIEAEFLTDTPIGNCFDLIAGTSIGGIIATALALGVPAGKVFEVLKDHGPEVFPDLWFKSMRKLLGKAPYEISNLSGAINACIGEATAQSSLRDVVKPLLVTTVDWVSAELCLLGSSQTPWRDGLGLSIMDALLATSAAPAHFPPHVALSHTFVDGGLAANAPDKLALQGARQMWAGAQLRMLSIGSANPLSGGNPCAMPKRGFRWAEPVIELCMHAQERQVVSDCTLELGTAYLRLNRHPSTEQIDAAKFDYATPASTAILIGLADEEFASIKSDKARLGRLLHMLGPSTRLTRPP